MMTDQQKKEIVNLRTRGYGYKKISQTLGVPKNTVSAYCRRNKLTLCGCKNCGKAMRKSQGTKPKLFCCDKCRNEWWNKHLDQVKRKAVYEFKCPHCGRAFQIYGDKRRKYCSHECYIATRFKGGDCHE